MSIRKPAPPIFFSIQCCHEVGEAPSFALVLWVDDGCYGTLVDWILTLRNAKRREKSEENRCKQGECVNETQHSSAHKHAETFVSPRLLPGCTSRCRNPYLNGPAALTSFFSPTSRIVLFNIISCRHTLTIPTGFAFT